MSEHNGAAEPSGEEATRRRPGLSEALVYKIGFAILGAITFFLLWAYAIATYGWFLGLGLGWIPAFFIAALIGALWPLWMAILAIPLWVVSLAIIVLQPSKAVSASAPRWRWPRSRTAEGSPHGHAERRQFR